MSEWDFPKRQQTFHPDGTKFEQVFQDPVALIAYAQYRRKHLVSKRENEWLPYFALEFSRLVRKVDRRQISFEMVVKSWEKMWLEHPMTPAVSTTNWAVVIEPIMPFIRGDLILNLIQSGDKYFLVSASNIVLFHLAKSLPDVQPQSGSFYEDFKAGLKTSEWREAKPYWFRRLFREAAWFVNNDRAQSISAYLKVHRAWLVEGYPKGSLPRLEADITGVIVHPFSKSHSQLEIKVANVQEILQ